MAETLTIIKVGKKQVSPAILRSIAGNGYCNEYSLRNWLEKAAKALEQREAELLAAIEEQKNER